MLVIIPGIMLLVTQIYPLCQMGLVPLLVIFDNTQPTHEEPSPDDGLAAAKDNTRTRNFSVEEDKLLVSTWLNVSQNPIQGVDQARSTLEKNSQLFP
jgi:hypothetical protein